ncbi:hypothetical protein Ddc_01208 [Ditylenchus destructor]|nr:hypothetical protein Ddc_01208 [Ditylenchus destructor]
MCRGSARSEGKRGPLEAPDPGPADCRFAPPHPIPLPNRTPLELPKVMLSPLPISNSSLLLFMFFVVVGRSRRSFRFVDFNLWSTRGQLPPPLLEKGGDYTSQVAFTMRLHFRKPRCRFCLGLAVIICGCHVFERIYRLSFGLLLLKYLQKRIYAKKINKHSSVYENTGFTFVSLFCVNDLWYNKFHSVLL